MFVHIFVKQEIKPKPCHTEQKTGLHMETSTTQRNTEVWIFGFGLECFN